MREAKEEEYILNSTAPQTMMITISLTQSQKAQHHFSSQKTPAGTNGKKRKQKMTSLREQKTDPIYPSPTSLLQTMMRMKAKGKSSRKREFEEMWSFGEIKQDKKPNSVSGKRPLDDDLF